MKSREKWGRIYALVVLGSLGLIAILAFHALLNFALEETPAAYTKGTDAAQIAREHKQNLDFYRNQSEAQELQEKYQQLVEKTDRMESNQDIQEAVYMGVKRALEERFSDKPAEPAPVKVWKLRSK